MKLIPQNFRVCVVVTNEGDELDNFLEYLFFFFF